MKKKSKNSYKRTKKVRNNNNKCQYIKPNTKRNNKRKAYCKHRLTNKKHNKKAKGKSLTPPTPPTPQRITVTITKMDGTEYKLKDMLNSTTISQIKKKIKELTGLKKSSQELYYINDERNEAANFILEDTETISNIIKYGAEQKGMLRLSLINTDMNFSIIDWLKMKKWEKKNIKVTDYNLSCNKVAILPNNQNIFVVLTKPIPNDNIQFLSLIDASANNKILDILEYDIEEPTKSVYCIVITNDSKYVIMSEGGKSTSLLLFSLNITTNQEGEYINFFGKILLPNNNSEAENSNILIKPEGLTIRMNKDKETILLAETEYSGTNQTNIKSIVTECEFHSSPRRIRKLFEKENSIIKDIVILPQSGNVVLCDSKNACIYVIDVKKAEVLIKFGEKLQVERLVSSICEKKANNIITSEEYTEVITADKLAKTTNPDFKSTANENISYDISLSNSDLSDGLFLQPICLGTDYDDNIIVSDACTNRIQIFDSQGNHLMTNRDFGNENNETIEFTWSSENYGMLVIAGTELQVYKRTKL